MTDEELIKRLQERLKTAETFCNYAIYHHHPDLELCDMCAEAKQAMEDVMSGMKTDLRLRYEKKETLAERGGEKAQ